MVRGGTRRNLAAGGSSARLIGGRVAIALGAIVFAAVIALPAGPAAARDGRGHHGSSSNNGNSNNDDGGNGGGTPGASPGVSSGGGSSSGEGNFGNPGAGSTASSGSTAGGGGGGGGGGVSRSSSGGGSIPLGSNAAGGEPGARVGLSFDNNSAGISAAIPLGTHRAVEHPAHPATHPIFTIPFERSATSHSLSHALTPHALSYGEPGTPGLMSGAGAPALTNRLIRSVTTTYSDRFVNHLGHSLRMQEPGGMQQVAVPGGAGGGHDLASKLEQAKHAIASAAASAPASATAATRSLATPTPASVVNNRFPGTSADALDARLFTVPMAGETRYVPHEIVVGVPAGLPAEQIADIAHRHGLAPVAGGAFAADGITLQRWRITDNRPLGDVIHALAAETGLQSAQPNFRFKLAQAAGLTEQPADGFSAQYAPEKLHLTQAHQLSSGAGVTIAVIDTGIDRTHPELAGVFAASFDAIGSKEPPDAHGTAIAGAIAAHGKLVGVAPGSRLLAIRAFSTVGADAEATTLTIVRSIQWAVAHGARVINMSFAGARDPLIGRALAEARRRGIVLIAAAGNGGPNSPPLYPAADANVIAVSATDIDDHLLDVANRGQQIALAAPGVDVLLPAPRARYQLATGTSFAAAHVAGIAALMLAKNPRLTPDDIRAELIATARDLGPKGRDDMFGAGLADAYKAVVAATHGVPQAVATNGAAAR